MFEPCQPKYDWGQKVVAGVDLYNDGSYPERETGALLVSRGSPGEIVQVGAHVEVNVSVYLVEFADGTVVGCLEEEITPV